MGALRDHTAFNIRKWAGRRKQKPGVHPYTLILGQNTFAPSVR